MIVLAFIARSVTIVALCCAIGLQWLALQSIACTAMIFDYSKDTSLCNEIAKTLDDSHRCYLCHVVNRARTAEKKSDLQLLTPKVDMICTKRAIILVRPFIHFHYATSDFSFDQVGRSPPAPPPRRLLG